jgi:hypothetical protein
VTLNHISLHGLWRRAAWRLAFFAVAATLAACSSQQDQGVVYGDHLYACCSETMTGQPIWRAGEDVKLHWYATPPTTTTDATAHRVDLKLTLTGPFATVIDLKSAVSLKGESAGVRTVHAPTLVTNDRSADTPLSDLALPGGLPAGYYNLQSNAEVGSSSAGGAQIIYLQP